jgi:hypothetical protein
MKHCLLKYEKKEITNVDCSTPPNYKSRDFTE